jgi:putative aldouronate transport system permease protein
MIDKERSVSSIILDIIVYTSLTLLVIVTLYPVLNVFSVSFSSESAYSKGLITVFPKEFTFESYKMILSAGVVPNSFKNSIIYTAVGTLINLLMTASLAYALSRRQLAFRKFYTILIMISMYFSGGLIPNFLLVRSLGMYNTMWALLIPGAISTYNMIIMRSFFEGIPHELEESAYLDGATDITIFFKIILPLSKASIATIGLFYAVSHWNSWFSSLIYLKDSVKYPLQMILRQIVIQAAVTDELAKMGEGAQGAAGQAVNLEGVKYATLVCSILPMLIIYPFIQKYFVKGAMVGAVKG